VTVQSLWHTYKLCTEELFRIYFPVFWLRFLKVLQPNSTYISKPKMYTVSCFFTLITIAWGRVRDDVLQDFEVYTKSVQAGTFYHLICILERTLPTVFVVLLI